MITQFFSNFLGNKNEREVNRIRPIVAKINQIEESLQRAEPSRLVDLTAEWKRHLARYHPLEMPPRYAIEAMSEDALLALTNAVESKFANLRSEFSGLPTKVEAIADSFEKAMAA